VELLIKTAKMKQYNLKPTLHKLSFGDLYAIALGEIGRGRHLTLVPMSPTDPDKPVEVVTSKTGKPKITTVGTDRQDWLARICCNGTYTRGSYGYAYVHNDDAENVELVAKGYGAEGDAGRLGNWFDYLLKIKDNTLIRVKEHGGHKRPAYYLYFDENDVTRLDESELDMFVDSLNTPKYGSFDAENLQDWKCL
jgi:hypothetical protein